MLPYPVKRVLLQIKPLVAAYLWLTGQKPSKSPKEFAHLLGMTSLHERKLFYDYGKKLYRNRGEIVDLGCWLGSTTVPLIEGLLENSYFTTNKRKVYAYDQFLWQQWMEPFMAGKYQEGESFLSEYQAIIKPYAHLVETKAGDLCEIGWNGQPIEFLLVDAMKNWDLTNTIKKDFYPYLIPGKSYVLHQDFSHFFTSWIHLLHYRFRNHFELVEHAETGGSALFRYTRQIPREQLMQTYSFADFSAAEIEEAFDHSLALTPVTKQDAIWAAKAMAYVHLNQLEKAKDILSTAAKAGFSAEQSTELKAVQAYVQ